MKFFSFYDAGGFQPQQEDYQLQAGDKFRTTCYYKDGSTFGIGSQDEMCIGFLLYYPAKKFNGIPFVCPYPGRFPCAEEYVATDLNDYEELGRTFGIGTPGLPVTSIEPPMTSNVPALAPIATPTSQDVETEAADTETESPTSKADFMQVYSLFVISLSSAMMVITFV